MALGARVAASLAPHSSHTVVAHPKGATYSETGPYLSRLSQGSSCAAAVGLHRTRTRRSGRDKMGQRFPIQMGRHSHDGGTPLPLTFGQRPSTANEKEQVYESDVLRSSIRWRTEVLRRLRLASVVSQAALEHNGPLGCAESSRMSSLLCNGYTG